MCGIIGYKGYQKAGDVVLNGLKKLEYRGYDSWGIAIKGQSSYCYKQIGKLEGANIDLPEGHTAIGHTRWATHGEVNEKNAHPQISNNKLIFVVHNGIIENYQALKNFLQEKGFVFYSDTDTEVIPNLIQYFMDSGLNFVDATKEAIKKLEGSYAIVVLHKNEESLIGARKESPLVLGVGDKEFFIASDIPAFLEHTKKVIYLCDYDFVVLNNELRIFNLKSGFRVEREINTIEWDVEQAKKGDFDHFMIKEICEQVDTLTNILKYKESDFEAAKNLIKNAQRICFVACGTSYHACLAASYTFSSIAKLQTNVFLASEFPNFQHFLDESSLIIAVSQSGETADVLSAVRAARNRGAKILSIVNVMGSSLTRESDVVLYLRAGPEISVLATKSYTSQLALLILLAYHLTGKFEEGKNILAELKRYVYYLTAKSTREFIKSLAEKLRYAQHIFLIGRKLQFPTALEAALKIKEVSYIHAEAFAGGELKHGPIALIEKGMPCIVFTSSETEKEILSNAEELKARGAFIIGVGPKNNNVFDFFIKVREAEEGNSICQIIPIQILAYQLALLRGFDPDKPRNLAKSVTVK